MENQAPKERIQSEDLRTVYPLLVGLCAPAMGSGKTAFAEILERDHGFVRVPLASTLKSMAAAFLEGTGMSPYDAREFIHDPELKESRLPCIYGMTPRYIMQTLGTEWGRECIGKNIWLDITMAKAKSLMASGKSVVIDDCRFTNEADAIVHNGGHMIMIERPGTEGTGTSHASEGELKSYPVDVYLMNGGTVDDLAFEARSIISDLRR